MGYLWFSNIFLQVTKNIFIHSRNISVSSRLANQSVSKQGKILTKIIDGTKKKRKLIFDDSGVSPSVGKLSLGKQIKHNKENSRRIAVLNSLFMHHISDLLVTGDFGVDVLSKGLQISRVSMNSDFNQLNVFWGSYKEESIVELEDVLPNVGYTLRHELSQLKVVGVVPRIVFVKDKYFSNGAKVDHLLRIADFGEDHVPSKLDSDFMNAPSFTLDKSKTMSDENLSDETTPTEAAEVMPPMRHDIFNLNHQLIMNKILKKMQKSRAIHRFEPNLAIKSDGTGITLSTLPELDNMNKDDRKEALAKFILSRKILQEKKKKKHNIDENIYIAQGLNNEDDVEENFEVEDYIEEDFEAYKFQN